MKIAKQQVFGRVFGVALVAFVCIGVCAQGGDLKTPTIAVDLPEAYNTPDGMTVDSRNNIVLSCPNINDTSYPAKMLLIDGNDKVSELYTLPKHPETGNVFPLGVVEGPDGNLYIADNQAAQGDTSHKSRLLRLNMKNGKAVSCDVVVEGFVIANGIDWYGDAIYVAETQTDPTARPLPSGAYRFEFAEFGDEPIKILPGGKDEHFVGTLYTENEELPVGANGLALDKDGNLYVADFGDAEIYKFVLDADGSVVSKTIFTAGQGMESCDGIKIDRPAGVMYVADFLGNAVHTIDLDTGRVTTIAKNGNTDGAGGALDRCSEVCLRDGKVYVANIDLPVAGNAYDAPHNISVFTLDE